MQFNKYGYILGGFLFTLVLVIFYGSSLSCNYHIQIVTSTKTWDGVCQFGKSSWIEKNSDSQWSIDAWSFAIGDQMFFINTGRKLIHRRTKGRSALDEFNDKNIIIGYGVHKFSTNRIIFFQEFPFKGVYVGSYTGRLSLFSKG
ncbi:hypothetical protein VFES401_11330 [Aliivibrio fischeri]|uniref:hypothetical protein n=1 Tax=Aliivibrio fischeri TaxID=668 RepID=UPI0007C4F31C|nr:hypothetical protein [Aliivibrio fischeri]TGA70301.1 hypothetical protein VFES401_11330 [Aliivibrio fischeri]